jgi:phosphate transport system permease protein
MTSTQFSGKRLKGILYTGSTGFAIVLILLMMLVMTIDITLGGIGKITWEFLSSPPKNGMTAGGIFPAIVGTVYLVIIMTLVGVPIGTVTAIYLSEYTSQSSTLARIIRFAVNNLASVPSIVFGLFGLGFFVQFAELNPRSRYRL